MSTPDLTNLLIGIVIGLIVFVSKMFISRLDRFEKIVQSILLSDVSMKKDIEKMADEIKDHEIRISKLES